MLVSGQITGRSQYMVARTIILASVVAGALASPATAQMVCSERDKFLKHLGDGYREAPIAMGLASNGMILEVLASATGSWTIILTKPTGLSCVVASGEAWEKIEQHLVLGPNEERI